MAAINFVVHGNPVAKSNSYRIFKSRMYKTAACKQWEAAVLSACKASCVASVQIPAFPKGVPCTIRIAWFKRDNRRADLDNILKSILDSLNGFAYDDDSQVCEIIASKHIDAKFPRVEISIY